MSMQVPFIRVKHPGVIRVIGYFMSSRGGEMLLIQASRSGDAWRGCWRAYLCSNPCTSFMWSRKVRSLVVTSIWP